MSCPRILVALVAALLPLSTPTSAETPPTASTAQESPGQRGFLGFLFGFHNGTESLEVLQLYPGGPAEVAGLEVGDVVVAFNGVSFRFASEIEARRAFDWIETGESIDLTVSRDGKEVVLSLVASRLPEPIRRENAEKLDIALKSESNATLQRILETNRELVLEKLDSGTVRLSMADSDASLDDVLELLTARHRSIREVISALAPGESVRVRISRTESGGFAFQTTREGPQAQPQDRRH